jgi:hypothetical protein
LLLVAGPPAGSCGKHCDAKDSCEEGPYCDGNWLCRCSETADGRDNKGPNCEDRGNVCIEDKGNADCALPTLEPCTDFFATRCRGQAEDQCGSVGLWAALVPCAGECTAFGTGCR